MTGIVRNPETSPVPGSIVRVTNTDTKKSWVSWTDESGKFEFPALPPGRYHIEASQLGFVPSSLDVELPVVPPGPIPMVLKVATLAQLTAPPPNSANAKQSSENAASASNRQTRIQMRQLPQAEKQQGSQRTEIAPVEMAVDSRFHRASLMRSARDWPLQQVAADFNKRISPAKAPLNPARPRRRKIITMPGRSSQRLSPPVAPRASGDSFLLQGTIGQGSAFNGPAGLAGLNVTGPEGPGGPGGQGGPGGAGGGRQRFGGGGGGARWSGGAIFGGGGGRRGPGGGAGGGGQFGGGGGGRFLRQQVNRIRFGFYDRYENSAFDARPYSITGVESPKVGHYDNRFGANIGGPLKIPHIYNGSDKTYFFVNYQHENEQTAVNTFSTVPTLDERNGLFCLANAGVPDALRSIQRDEYSIPDGRKHKLRKRCSTADWSHQ